MSYERPGVQSAIARMSRHVRVTVLMTVYNGAAYVRAAVASLLEQTYADFELLVVDDASTDGSGDIVAAMADPRIRLVRNNVNLGLTRSLNRGLEIARGELIARQDADDLSAPDRLTKQVEFLDAHPDVALVGSWYRKMDAAGASLGDRHLPEDHALLRWALLFYCPFVHSAIVFRRHIVVGEHSGYDERFLYGEDYDLWSRVARCHRVANIPAVLVAYRQGPATMTSTLGVRSDEVLRIACRNIANLGAPPPTALEHHALGGLVAADESRVTPDEVLPALTQLLGILERFCDSPWLTVDEAHRVRAAVGSSAAAVVGAHARRLTDDEYRAARSLLSAAAPVSGTMLPASRHEAAIRRVVESSWIGRLRGTKA
jgi:hypothetical protein